MENKYTNLREVTPREMACAVAACPSIYEATIDGREVYLAMGKKIKPSNVGLEKKVGKGEALVEVPRDLIDNKGK